MRGILVLICFGLALALGACGKAMPSSGSSTHTLPSSGNYNNQNGGA